MGYSFNDDEEDLILIEIGGEYVIPKLEENNKLNDQKVEPKISEPLH